MRVVLLLLLLLLLLFVTSSYQQCNTPIIRDIIQGGGGESDFIASLVGTDKLPLINGSRSIVLVQGSNPSITPIFKLNASYYITAVDLQFGDATGDAFCNQNVMVEQMELIRIGIADPPSVPIQIGYTNSDNRIDLLELGNTNNNRIIRLKLNPILGRYLKYTVGTTDPFEGTSCLRTEIYGCLSTPPANSTLLQYNLIQPTQNADSLYTGVTSQGYLSGGEGLLNDGVIGTSPDTDPSQSLGWTDPSLANPEILILFSYKVSVRTISLFYGNVSGTVSISSETGAVSESSQVTQMSGRGYNVVYSYDGLTAGLLKIDLTGNVSVLLTEIEVLGPGGNNLLRNEPGTSVTTPGITVTTAITTPTMSVTGMNSTTPSITPTPAMTTNNTITTTNNPLTTEVTTLSWVSAVLAIISLISISINITLVTIFCLFCCKKLRRRNTDDSYVDMKPAPTRHDYETVDAVTDSQYQIMQS